MARNIFEAVRAISELCALVFIVLRFFFGEGMNDWHKKGPVINVIIKVWGIFAILGMIFFMINVMSGNVI